MKKNNKKNKVLLKIMIGFGEEAVSLCWRGVAASLHFLCCVNYGWFSDSIKVNPGLILQKKEVARAA